MRKKREILRAARLLSGELSAVGEGSVTRMADGSTVDVVPYAHGAAAALGLLVLYAEGHGMPTTTDVVRVALDWSEEQAKATAEHPEDVASETIDLREGAGDHE